MRYSEAVRHLENLGLDVGTMASKRTAGRDGVPKRHHVPILMAKNGAISKKLQRMIRQSRADARKSL